MALAITARRPTLYWFHLPTDGFCSNGCRTVHEQLKHRVSDAGLAIQIAFPLIAEHEKLCIGSEVIEKFEIVFALSAKLIEKNPVIGADINDTAPMSDLIS